MPSVSGFPFSGYSKILDRTMNSISEYKERKVYMLIVLEGHHQLSSLIYLIPQKNIVEKEI